MAGCWWQGPEGTMAGEGEALALWDWKDEVLSSPMFLFKTAGQVGLRDEGWTRVSCTLQLHHKPCSQSKSYTRQTAVQRQLAMVLGQLGKARDPS